MRAESASTDERPRTPQFTLRAALAAYSVIGVILSIPLLGLGFTLTALIFAALFVLQLPLFLLFGAFGANGRLRRDDPQEHQEWDRWSAEHGDATHPSR